MSSVRKLTMWAVGFGLLVCLAGCVAPMTVSTRLVPGADHGADRPLALFAVDQALPKKYEVIGVVTSKIDLGPAPKVIDDLLVQLRSEASRMGADALAGYYTKSVSAPDRVSTWSSALAIRTLGDGEEPAPASRRFLVAIPHVTIPSKVAGKGRVDLLDDQARSWAQFILAQKGYYAKLVDPPAPDPFVPGCQQLNATELETYGGEETDGILGIRILDSSYLTVLLMSSESIRLEATLYSKADSKESWHNSGAGSGTTGWIINMAASDLKIQMAIQWAMAQALGTLPSIASGSGG